MIPATFLLLAATAAAEPGPLVVESPSVDLGELRANKPLVQAFRLKNTGAAPVTITDVAGVCGCVRPRLSARVVEPGQTSELSVSINLLTQPEGSNTWKLAVRYRVESRPPATGERVVQVAAKVRKDVNVEPAALMLCAEKEITGALTVIDRRDKPLTVTAVRLGLKDVRADVKSAADAGGRRTQKIELTVADACPPGQHADEVCIDTDDPEYRELRIPIRVVKKSAQTGVQAMPGNVIARFARGQTTATSLVRLRDLSDGEVIVEKAESDHAAIACKCAAGPGNMATLRVTVDLDKARAAGVGVVSVRLKGPTPETILIPVSWTLP